MLLPRGFMIIISTELAEVSTGEGSGVYWENRSEVLNDGRVETYPTDWLELVSEDTQIDSGKVQSAMSVSTS
jgi:hypothetical protein